MDIILLSTNACLIRALINMSLMIIKKKERKKETSGSRADSKQDPHKHSLIQGKGWFQPVLQNNWVLPEINLNQN